MNSPAGAPPYSARAAREGSQYPLMLPCVVPVWESGPRSTTRGDLDAAVADYNQVIRLLKSAPPAEGAAEGGLTLMLAHCRREEARYDRWRDDEAEADFTEARSRHPNSCIP